MLEKIQNQTIICNKSQLKYLIVLLSTGSKSLNDLKVACSSKDYTFSRNFNSLIVFLKWLNIVEIVSNKVKLLVNKNHIFSSNNIISHKFFNNLFISMRIDNELEDFLNINNVKYIANEDIILINNNLIPFSFSQIRNLLVDLGFLDYDSISENHFIVNSHYKSWFIKEIIPLVDNQEISRKLPLLKLKEIHKKNELYGKEAEEYILSFEKKRLINHIRFYEIKILSEEWSNAGYDIQSFDDINSIIFDRFIEVKSYEGNKPYFYWSRNEYQVAKRKQKKYWLYLVNRKEMNTEDYLPIMIQNPYQKIFKNDLWKKETENWKISIEE